jgi:hypothetical protein
MYFIPFSRTAPQSKNHATAINKELISLPPLLSSVYFLSTLHGPSSPNCLCRTFRALGLKKTARPFRRFVPLTLPEADSKVFDGPCCFAHGPDCFEPGRQGDWITCPDLADPAFVSLPPSSLPNDYPILSSALFVVVSDRFAPKPEFLIPDVSVLGSQLL